MARKPTVEEVRDYIYGANPFNLRDASIEMVSEGNHLIYRLKKNGKTYALRMINPESHRREEWISLEEEYALLNALPIGLAPRVYHLDEYLFTDKQFQSRPFLIQEFIKATCFNELKPLSREHLEAAARAIAELNRQDITPRKFPFLEKYREKGFQKREAVWYFRLLDSLRRSPRKDILNWAIEILPICHQAAGIIGRSESLLPEDDWTFHFDGAHCGNVFWRDGKAVFLDWEKVSYRNDPTFTLVRFAISASTVPGTVPEEMLETLIRAYLEIRPVLNFKEIAQARLLERQISDLVWVVWEHTRKKDKGRVEEATSVPERYRHAKELLQMYE